MDTLENIRKMENCPDGISDDETDIMVPQIQKELDKLNQASTEINRLENELDEARSKYRSIISETSGRMEAVSKDRKKSIQRAREYYKLKEEAKVAQGEALKAARQFQSATGVYNAAKETVALAECSLIEETDTPTAHLSSAWQEMLSHAITKVNEAEREKAKSEQEHKRRASRYAELEGRIQLLEKKYTKSIRKAKPYFDLKTELDIKLMQQKHNVNDLQTAIKVNKMKYSESFRTLEAISDAIHISRNNKIWSMFPRMPGVGSDTFSVSSGLSDMGLDRTISTDDFTSKGSDMETDTSDQEFDDNVIRILTDDRTQNVTSREDSARQGLECSSSTTENNEQGVGDANEVQNQTNLEGNNKTDRTEMNGADGSTCHEVQNINEVCETVQEHPNMDALDSSAASHELINSHTINPTENDNTEETTTDDNSDDVFEEASEFHNDDDNIDRRNSDKDNTAGDQCSEGGEAGAQYNKSENENMRFVQNSKQISDKSHHSLDKPENVQTLENNTETGSKSEGKAEAAHQRRDTAENKGDMVKCPVKTDDATNAQDTNSESVVTDMRTVERPSLSGAED